MTWLLLTISMGIGVLIGAVAYVVTYPTKIEIVRQKPCEYDKLDDEYRESPKTLPASKKL